MMSKADQAQVRRHYIGECPESCDINGDCVATRFTFAEAIGYQQPRYGAGVDCWDDLVSAGLVGADD